LAKARFGAVGACFAHQEESQAKKWLKAAEKDLKGLLKSREDWAEAHALLAGVYGMQIALSPMKGMFLGPKSSRHIEQALSIDPDNALAHYQQGSSLYNTPAMFGGDVEKAIRHLERARILYEQQSDGYNWEYLNTLAMLGQAYHYQDRYQDARRVYEEALQAAPAFGWVKNVLLPELKADM
jgi:tetratricopeptide (TPR) repeat protein